MTMESKCAVIDRGAGSVTVKYFNRNPTQTVEERMAAKYPGLTHEIVERSVVPNDRTFRKAWKPKVGGVEIDMSRAKNVAHARRRFRRSERMKPHDRDATIPVKAVEAEAARQVIRDADAALQVELDAALNPTQLKQRMRDGGLLED